jgi:AAA family ATP:ADP antiporter
VNDGQCNGLAQGNLRQTFADIPRQQWPKALLLSAFFFLVIASYWILKPL